MSNQLIHIKNLFDPLLDYIHLQWYKPGTDELQIKIVIPVNMKIDINKIQDFFHNATLYEDRNDQRHLIGLLKNNDLKKYILECYYENKLGKIHYEMTFNIENINYETFD